MVRWPAAMITTVVQLDWLGFGQCNLDLYIVEETLRYELLLWQWGQHLLTRHALLFAHGFILAIKLRIVDLVERLLHRFSLPSLGQELRDHIVHCLILDIALLLQLLLLILLFLTEGHRLDLRSLPEGSSHIRIIGIRVLPELPCEAFALLPVGEEVLRKERH